MPEKDNKITKKEASREYNKLVNEFRDLVSALKAIILVHSDETPQLALAKKRISEVQTSIQKLREIITSGNIAEFVHNANVLDLEIRIFNELLDKIDDEVEPQQIRLLCERMGDSRDDELAALARFYIQRKKKDEKNMGKLDFVITEAATERSGRERFLKPEPELSRILGIMGIEDAKPSDYEEAMIHEFQHALERIQQAKSIEEIWDNDIIKTMKSFKNEVSENILSPGVIRVVVQYNIGLHNKLVKLYDSLDAGIVECMETVSTIEKDMSKMDEAKRHYAESALEKAKGIYDNFKQLSESRGRDLTLLIEAAKTRKALAETISNANEMALAVHNGEESGDHHEIEVEVEMETVEEAPKAKKAVKEKKAEISKTPEKPKEPEKWTIPRLSASMNEILTDLLRLEGNIAGKKHKTSYGFNLSRFSDFEKNLFMMDVDALTGEDKQVISNLKDATVLSQKLELDYRAAKKHFEPEEFAAMVENEYKKACALNRSLQYFMDTYGSHIKSVTRIDILKVKNVYSRSLNYYWKRAKSDNIILEKED